MKKQLTSLLIASASMFNLFAEEVIVKDTDINAGENVTWTADNTYYLDGFVFVESGATLTIEPGTVIMGVESPSTADNASALIISRGATIMAEGTQSAPIIFTTELDDMDDNEDLTYEDKGLWGGLIILGYGKIAFGSGDVSLQETNIEGIPSDETRALFGGTNDADNSGVLKYVSIRHGGAALSEGNEINGLTLGAVGSATTIEYVEVFANDDDGIEWFGGKAELKHIVVAFCGDDSYDYDFGWRGKGQFFLSVQGDNGDNGGEHDGAKPDGEAEYSNPTIYNATYIGSGANSDAKNSTALHFRDNAAGTYANSIFTDFANYAIEVEDLAADKGVDSRNNMENGELNLLNNIWYNFGSGSLLDASANGVIRATSNAEDSDCQFLISHLTSNENVLADPEITSITRTDGFVAIDPRPNASGIAIENLSNLPSNDNFYTATTFKGAFETDLWTDNWTALNQYGHIVGGNISINEIANTIKSKIYPNPTADKVNILFENLNTDDVSIYLFDIKGQLIETKTTRSNTTSFEIHNSGIYLVRILNDQNSSIHKVVVN